MALPLAVRLARGDMEGGRVGSGARLRAAVPLAVARPPDPPLGQMEAVGRAVVRGGAVALREAEREREGVGGALVEGEGDVEAVALPLALPLGEGEARWLDEVRAVPLPAPPLALPLPVLLRLPSSALLPAAAPLALPHPVPVIEPPPLCEAAAHREAEGEARGLPEELAESVGTKDGVSPLLCPRVPPAVLVSPALLLLLRVPHLDGAGAADVPAELLTASLSLPLTDAAAAKLTPAAPLEVPLPAALSLPAFEAEEDPLPVLLPAGTPL